MNSYQWYPGHMARAKRMMEEDLKLIDVVIELLDARIPRSSSNPDIAALANGKARLVVLGKADLADPAMTAKWEAFYRSQGLTVTSIDARKSGLAKKLIPLVMEACREKIERNARRGIKNRPMRALVAGIPNVGKSTFINSLAGKGVAKTGNKPGVTKGKQWIRLRKDLELLDSPGILWPKQSDPVVGERLAMIGSVNDEIFETQELAFSILRVLTEKCPEAFAARYGFSPEKVRESVLSGPAIDFSVKSEDPPDDVLATDTSCLSRLLEEIATARNALKKGGVADSEKAALILIDDFRKGQFGRMTLDEPLA